MLFVRPLQPPLLHPCSSSVKPLPIILFQLAFLKLRTFSCYIMNALLVFSEPIFFDPYGFQSSVF